MTKKTIFDKKNILVVGGAGFVGSHLCDELVKDNKVVCLDNFITGSESNISHLYQNDSFEFVNQDVTKPFELEKDPSLVDFRIEFQGIQEIYFLASPTSPKDYLTKPIETMLANSAGLASCLDLAVKYRSKFFYASSPAIYGYVGSAKPIKEDYVGATNHLEPRACYSEAIRFGETLVENYREQHNLDTKIMRIFNAYGPRMRLSDGRMIPEMIKSAISGEDLFLYGDKKNFGTYFYISDLIKAITRMMDSAENGPFNVGSDWKISLMDIAQKVIKLSGSASEIKFKPSQELSVDQTVPSISEAKSKLDWFPIVLLDEGLKETIDYLNAQRGILEPIDITLQNRTP